MDVSRNENSIIQKPYSNTVEVLDEPLLSQDSKKIPVKRQESIPKPRTVTDQDVLPKKK